MGDNQFGKIAKKKKQSKHAGNRKIQLKTLANGHQQQARIRSEMGDWD